MNTATDNTAVTFEPKRVVDESFYEVRGFGYISHENTVAAAKAFSKGVDVFLSLLILGLGLLAFMPGAIGAGIGWPAGIAYGAIWLLIVLPLCRWACGRIPASTFRAVAEHLGEVKSWTIYPDRIVKRFANHTSEFGLSAVKQLKVLDEVLAIKLKDESMELIPLSGFVSRRDVDEVCKWINAASAAEHQQAAATDDAIDEVSLYQDQKMVFEGSLSTAENQILNAASEEHLVENRWIIKHKLKLLIGLFAIYGAYLLMRDIFFVGQANIFVAIKNVAKTIMVPVLLMMFEGFILNNQTRSCLRGRWVLDRTHVSFTHYTAFSYSTQTRRWRDVTLREEKPEGVLLVFENPTTVILVPRLTAGYAQWESRQEIIARNCQV